MRFNSLIYLTFLLIVVVGLWLIPRRMRKSWLLGASWVFYGSWHYPFLLLLIGSSTVNHLGASWILAAKKPLRKRRGAVVIAFNLVLLCLFKYLDWLVGNANSLLVLLTGQPEMALSLPGWVLPLGISFYLFQAISFIIDVTRDRETQHGFWDFQLYLAFFPQLIAGPIMRAKEFLPQLIGKWTLTPTLLRDGLRLVITGLFIKVVLADNLAPAIDRAYTAPTSTLGTLDVWVMAVAFGMQVYFDFSGYSRIAIGSANLCGLQLVKNFDFPYKAISPVDFWNRWHMSLSRWIRDYLFFPMAAKRPSLYGMCRAAIITMTLCGIWHGAGWTFVVWGLWHGLMIAGYHIAFYGRQQSRPIPGSAPTPTRMAIVRRRLSLLVGWGITFCLVSLGWLFFRCQTVDDAWALTLEAVTPWSGLTRALPGSMYLHVAVVALGVWVMPFVWRAWKRLDERLVAGPGIASRAYAASESVFLGALCVSTVIYMHGQQTFIYFQF